MKTTLEEQEQKAYLLREAFDIAKIDLRYEALYNELERENPEKTKKVDDIMRDIEGKLNGKEFSCLSLFLEQHARFERLEEHGFILEEIGIAVMGAERLIKRAQKAGEITDEVFGG